MDNRDIISFSAPTLDAPLVEAFASPTLELAYAFYFLSRADSPQRLNEVTWTDVLEQADPSLAEAIRTFWKDDQTKGAHDILHLACDFGYAADSGVERFLGALSDLPAEALKRISTYYKDLEDKSEADREKHKTMLAQLEARFEHLNQAKVAKHYQSLVERLWQVLKPVWHREGKTSVDTACATFLENLRETDDVLSAIPKHHFTQFESSAKGIHDSQEKGKLRVIPLYFASSGGFNFEFEDFHYLGFGLQSEHYHNQIAQKVEAVALTLKALSDPTRLLLLTLIDRYSNFSLTVSDLAKQLSVSQPTVSGHLKVLKEADLVTLEKRGNKSFYQLNHDSVTQVTAALIKLLNNS